MEYKKCKENTSAGRMYRIMHLSCTPLHTFALLVLLVINPVWAQDIHFSQLDVDPLLFNPAYSGFFEGRGRFGVVYRNQWASVTTPFQTVTATAELNLTSSQRNRNALGAGLWVSNDRAGTLNYGATTVSAILSYYQSFDRDGSNILSVGLEAGVGQSGFDVANIVLDDETEEFVRNRALYPTFGAGVAWFRQYSDVFHTKIGMSVRNINEPDISYTGLTDTRLSRKYNFYARAEWRMSVQVGIMPVVGYQRQKRFSELVYGADVRWYLREEPQDYLALTAGLIGRHGDAVSMNLSVLWRTWTFAFAYDANVSKLAEASHTLGAFEIGILYMMPKKNKKHKALPCPII